MNKLLSLILILIPSLVFSSIYEYEEPFTGARPLGMGGAFMAISDDANAISYNPAGLANIKYSQIGWMYSPVYISGFFRSYANFLFPISRFNVIGVDWYHTGFEDKEIGSYGVPELEFSEGEVNAGFGTQLYEDILFGLTLKILYISAAMDGEAQGKGTGYNLNLGILFNLNENFKIGITGNNVLPSFNDTKKWGMTIKYENGVENIKYHPSVRLGLGYTPVKNMNLSLDLGDPVCFGVEYWPFNFFSLRGGTRYTLLNSNLSFSGGASLRYWIGQIDYALNYSSGLNLTHYFGASVVWGYQAYLIDVVNVDMQGIFPSIYKSYAKQDVIKITLKNKSKNPLEARVGFEAEKIMKAPTEKKVVLKPNVMTEISMPLVFSDDITETKDDSVVSGNVILSYTVDDRESKDINAQKFTLYSRNALVWDDFDKIVGFVTPQDDKIIEFSRYVLQNFGTRGNYIISKNFHRAMLIFHALGILGVSYVPDPNNPFRVSSQAIDYIQYPRETLKIKTGDCDDCTVLYASCLESIGIRTAAILTPDHIFMMFDSGISPEEAKEYFNNEELYLTIEDTVWVPVETTMYGKSFFSAIKEGISSCQKSLESEKEGAINIVDIESAWSKYPSATIKSKDYNIGTVENKVMMNSLYNDVVYYIGIKEGVQFTELLNQIKVSPNDAKLQNQAGNYFGKYGLFDISKKYFDEAIRLDPNWASPHNNLGNIYLLIEDYDKSISEYEQALKLAPNDPSIIENLNVARQLKNKK